MGRLSALTLALAAVLAFMIDAADARVGRGGSLGSRGTRTYTTPPSTQTAPTAAKPVEKSITQPGTQTGVAAAAKPAAAAPAASRFGSGFGGLLLGGLLGAGLFGLLSGAGLFGGMTGFASFLGLLLQGALIAGIVYLVMAYFRGRQQPAPAYGRAGAGPGTDPMARSALNGGLGGAGASAAQAALTIGPVDFDAFERLLSEIQAAYSREDADALADMSTPEMLTFFLQEIREQAQEGVRNEVTGIKLLQGDLSESWRENGADYATVAMRYALTDVTLDRKTGQVIAGDPSQPTEATEFWTFRRETLAGADAWQVSAIQQAA